ncbi:MAG: hypothetical protein ACPGXK_02195 [Phycisphaerae bacterium]
MTVDALGFVVVAACLAATLAILSDQSERRSQTIPELEQVINDTSIAISQLEQQAANQELEIGELRKKLFAPGQLPQVTSMENYIQELSSLAATHDVQVVLQKPLEAATYPGLLEERLSYSVSGAGANIVQFLKAVEQAEHWADVGYLNIRQQSSSGNRGRSTEVQEEVSALLTFSLFSHRADEESADGESTASIDSTRQEENRR